MVIHMSGPNGANAVSHAVLMQYGREQELVVSIVEKMTFKNVLIIWTRYSPENSTQFVFVLVVSAVIVEMMVTIMKAE